MSNQLVNTNGPPTDTDQPYYQSYKSIESIDLFVQRNNQTNSLLYGKCDFMGDEYALNDTLISNQLIGDRFASQLDSQLNSQLTDPLNSQFGYQLNANDHFDNQLNQFHNSPLIIDKPDDKLSSLLLADVVKCSQSARSSDDEFNDEKALDQARQNNDSALSMCSSDDSVIMITKFESLAKIMKDQHLQPGDFLNRENGVYNAGAFGSDSQAYGQDDKQLNSTSVTPSSFDQQIHTATGSSFSSIEHTPSNNQLNDQLSDQLKSANANCASVLDAKQLYNCVNTSDDDVKQQDKTLTGEQINANADEEEWNFDERRRHSAEDSLLPLKEDLADWINRIFGEFFFRFHQILHPDPSACRR